MYSIGIEIAENEINVGLCTVGDKTEVLSSSSIPATENLSEVLASAAEVARNLIDGAGLSIGNIECAGIAIDAPVCGTVAIGSVFGENADLAELKNFLDVKEVKAVKTANALALAEEELTFGKGYSLAYVSLDKTIGFGLLIDSVPYTASSGLASDIAHTVIQHGGKECACKNKGCFEAYCSLDAFKETERKEYVSYLACGITNVMNLFQPNVVVIGGKVMELDGEALLAEISEIITRENYARNSTNKSRLSLPGVNKNGALIGAVLA